MAILETGVNAKGQTREEALWDNLRKIRNDLIASTDYLLAADYPITQEKLALVKEYRQALRDITKLEGAPFDGGGNNTPWPVQNF